MGECGGTIGASLGRLAGTRESSMGSPLFVRTTRCFSIVLHNVRVVLKLARDVVGPRSRPHSAWVTAEVTDVFDCVR